MGVSINWLKEYVDFKCSAQELADQLTMAGIAIEGVEKLEDDELLELDLTPNRADCLGLINLAREVAALQGSQVKVPAVNLQESSEPVEDYIKIEVKNPDLCKRYAARIIKNVKIGPSPQWLQKKLESSGIRSINNVVDVTNFVLLESNQPLHAFDYDLLNMDKRIIVRTANKGEKITTLDGITRELDETVLVISDGPENAVAIAGVMGGQNTEINYNTVNVLLEGAVFSAPNIRRTSRKLALRTDSSARFEKGADINAPIYALNRAAALIQELAGGEVLKGIYDVYPQPQPEKVIRLRTERVNKLLGINLGAEAVKSYLQKLNLKIMDNGDDFEVTVPSYRQDLEMEVDLIEEIARLFGYDQIPTAYPVELTTPGGLTDYQKFRDLVKDIMSRHMLEVINYSFISPRLYDHLLLPEDSEYRQCIKIANPLSEEQSQMRTLLIPGLLETVSRNLARKNQSLAMYEMGAVFGWDAEGQPREILKLAGIVCGKTAANWIKNGVEMDFFYLKGILENLFGQLGIEANFIEHRSTSFHPGRTALILANGTRVGIMGEIHPQVNRNFQIKERVCAFELNAEKLFAQYNPQKKMKNISKFPAVDRDLALLVNKDVKVKQILDVVREAGGELLQEVRVFDIYEGEQIPPGYKSIALRGIFQSLERTLTEAEVNEAMENIISALQKSGLANLR